MPFPGPAAILPCLGAALVIYSPRNRAALSPVFSSHRGHSSFVGLISYSLYLWHWPVLCFRNSILISANRQASRACCLIASFFRPGDYFVALCGAAGSQQASSNSQAYRFGGRRLAMALLACSATVTASQRRWFAATSAARAAALSWPSRMITRHELRIVYIFRTAKDVRDHKDMPYRRQINAQPSFLLWGDSHADAILPAVSKLPRAPAAPGYSPVARSCPPLLGRDDTDAGLSRFQSECGCRARTQFQNIREVITRSTLGEICGRISLTATNRPATSRCSTISARAMETVDNHAVFERGLARTLKANFNICTRRLLLSPPFRKSAGRCLPYLRAGALASRIQVPWRLSRGRLSGPQKFVLAAFVQRRETGTASTILLSCI